MREKLRDMDRVQHIADAVDDILEFTFGKSFEEFRTDKILKHAVFRNFTIIGEAANLLTDEYKNTHREVEWFKMIGMRHVLVHGYYQADDQIVWQAIVEDLPVLRDAIKKEC